MAYTWATDPDHDGRFITLVLVIMALYLGVVVLGVLNHLHLF